MQFKVVKNFSFQHKYFPMGSMLEIDWEKVVVEDSGFQRTPDKMIVNGMELSTSHIELTAPSSLEEIAFLDKYIQEHFNGWALFIDNTILKKKDNIFTVGGQKSEDISEVCKDAKSRAFRAVSWAFMLNAAINQDADVYACTYKDSKIVIYGSVAGNFIEINSTSSLSQAIRYIDEKEKLKKRNV